MNKKGRCKNGYPIVKNNLLLMRHVVGVCECSHRYFLSEIPALYYGDKYSKSKERFHIYWFVVPLICGGCGRYISSITIACKPLKEYEDDWRNELADNLTAKDLLGTKTNNG